MAFCTQCGHRNPDDNAYCEECGVALRGTEKPPAHSAPAETVPSTARPVGRRGLAIGAGATAAILAAGIGAWFWLAPPAASERNFSAAVQQYVDKHPEFVRAHACLGNFRYDRDPAVIADYDKRSRQWFDMLVESGVYEAPKETVSGGWFQQKHLQYQLTEAGKKSVQGNRLCFAKGLRVKSIASFTPPQQQGEMLVSRAEVVLELTEPSAWSRSQTAQSLTDGLEHEKRRSLTLVRSEGQWRVADGSEPGLRELGRRALPRQADSASAQGPGWLSRISNFFSSAFGSNPLLGKWEANAMGMVMVQYEFTADSMQVGDDSVPVRYEVKQDSVVVYPEEQDSGMVIQLVNQDTIKIGNGLAAVELKRVR